MDVQITPKNLVYLMLYSDLKHPSHPSWDLYSHFAKK